MLQGTAPPPKWETRYPALAGSSAPLNVTGGLAVYKRDFDNNHLKPFELVGGDGTYLEEIAMPLIQESSKVMRFEREKIARAEALSKDGDVSL